MATSTRSATFSAVSCLMVGSSMWVSSSRMAETSVATPVMDRQSGRLGVISQSITVSPMPYQSTKSTPTGASSGRIMMPEWSELIPSSRAEQFMP